MPPRYSLAVRDMPAEERPRERLAHHGPQALSASELLAILLRTGTAKETVTALADRVLTQAGNLRGMAHASLEELQKIDGIGPAKAVEIQAAIELGKRVAAFSDDGRAVISGPQDVANLLMSDLRHETQEHFRVLMLDTKNQVLRIRNVSLGTANETVVHPREVFRPAVQISAVAVIVAHNHPSGDPTPSREDITVTKRLVEAGKVVGIDLLDHVVIGDGRFVSLKERGLM